MPNYCLSIARTFLQGGFPIIIGFFLGNILPPQEYGQYVALFLCATTVAIFFTLPIDSSAIHYIVKSTDIVQQNRFYTSAVALNLSNALIIGVGMVALRPVVISLFHFESISWPDYLLISFVAMLGSTFVFFSKLMTVRSLFKEQLIILVCCCLVQAVIIGILAYLKASSLAYVSSFIFFYLSGIILCERRLKQEFSFVLYSDWSAHIRKLIYFGGLIYLGAVAGFLDEKLDQLCINYFLPKDSLAVYSYAIGIGMVFYGVGLGISQVTFPAFCNLFMANEQQATSSLYGKTINRLFALISSLGLILLLHARPIISLLLPQTYLAMIPSLAIIIPGITLYASFAGVGTVLTAAGRPAYKLCLTITFLLLNGVLNVILIPRLGITGAAIATSCSFSLRSVCGYFLTSRVTAIRYDIVKLMLYFLLFISAIVTGQIVPLFLRELVLVVFVATLFFSFLERQDRIYLTSLFFT